MKRILRPLGAALAAAVAAAVVVAVPPSAVSAPNPGDPFGPTPVLLTGALHKSSKVGDIAAAPLGDKVVFRAGTPETGQELWITDGTPAGTRLLADIWPGVEDGSPAHFAGFGGRVFFAASDGVHGFELWVTDGTPGGTRMVADLAAGLGESEPRELTVAGGTLYFAAETPALGDELWATDGTAAGTRLVDDLLDGPDGSRPRSLTAFGDRVVFGANVDDSGLVVKPFLSDGTAAGTVRLDPLPLAERAVPLEFVQLGDRLLFSVFTPASGVDLWTSAGAPGDARLVKDIYPGGDDGVAQLTVFRNRLVFTARTQAAGLELWTSDGSPGGTQLLRDIDPGVASSVPTGFQVLGDRVWFGASDAEHGRELWSSDGTTGGTALVRDFVPLADGADPYTLGVVGTRALFAMETAGTGYEPWVLEPDGRLEPLSDLEPGANDYEPVTLAAVGNTWVFAETGAAVGSRVFAATLQPSTAQARPKRAYSAKKARAKRVVVKVVVTPAVTGGTVAIMRKGRVVGRADVVNGVAKVRIKKRLKPGKHRLSAVYRGSVWAQASAADRFRVRVLKARS